MSDNERSDYSHLETHTNKHHVTAVLQLAPALERSVARATSATKSFRALLDVEAVLAARKRFERFVTRSPGGGCHFFTGHLSNGYGGFKVGGVAVMAHRYSYVLAFGVLQETLDVDHKCHVRNCVNPDHLEAITHAENIRRREDRRTHCLRGHLLSGSNLTSDTTHERVCRACLAIRRGR